MLIRAQVYDPVLRMLHWVNAFLITALLASGLVAMYLEPGPTRAWLHVWHGYAGAALIVGLTGRLTWGAVGPGCARLSDMWQADEWRAILTGRKSAFAIPQHHGHHPSASLAYLGLYFLITVTVMTGLILLAINQGTGPLAWLLAWDVMILPLPENIHITVAWIILGFVGLHLAALILHPLLHGLPVAQAMLTGVQYIEKKEKA